MKVRRVEAFTCRAAASWCQRHRQIPSHPMCCSTLRVLLVKTIDIGERRSVSAMLRTLLRSTSQNRALTVIEPIHTKIFTA
jgi:hypothetical protein